LGIIFLVENLMVVPLCLIIGYLGDKTKVWKGLALNLFLGCLSGFSFLYFALENGYGLFISFIGFMLTGHLVYMQVRNSNLLNYKKSLIMLGKLAKPDSRGMMFGTYGVLGSTGVLITMKFGGDLYEHSNGTIFEHRWPFIIALISMLFMFLVTFLLGVCGKVKV
jgi:hypothetical protein